MHQTIQKGIIIYYEIFYNHLKCIYKTLFTPKNIILSLKI